MNTQAVKTVMTRLTFVSFVAVAMMIATPFISKANESKDKVVAVSKSDVSVKHTGTNEKSVVFRVQFHNAAAQKFTFIIKNHAGDILYSGQYNDINFSKTVHLLKEEDEMNPTFVIRTANQSIENSFTVNTSTASQEEVTVTRL